MCIDKACIRRMLTWVEADVDMYVRLYTQDVDADTDLYVHAHTGNVKCDSLYLGYCRHRIGLG